MYPFFVTTNRGSTATTSPGTDSQFFHIFPGLHIFIQHNLQVMKGSGAVDIVIDMNRGVPPAEWFPRIPAHLW